MSGDNISSPEGNDGGYDVPGPEHVEPEDLSPETGVGLGNTSDDADTDVGPADREDFSSFAPTEPAPRTDNTEAELFEELEPAGPGSTPEAEATDIFDEADEAVAQAETARTNEQPSSDRSPTAGEPAVTESGAEVDAGEEDDETGDAAGAGGEEPDEDGAKLQQVLEYFTFLGQEIIDNRNAAAAGGNDNPEEADGDPDRQENEGAETGAAVDAADNAEEPDGHEPRDGAEATEEGAGGEEPDETGSGTEEPERSESPEEEAGDRGRDPVDSAKQAHEDVMKSVREAQEDIRRSIEAAKAEIDEMIRTGQVPEIQPADIENVEFDDIEDEIPELRQLPDDQSADVPDWEEWEEYDSPDTADGDDTDRPDNGKEEPDGRDQPVEPDDKFKGIPDFALEEVEARTRAILERSHELVSQDKPVAARDYVQEMRPLDEMPKGGIIFSNNGQMTILRPDDASSFSDEWQAHIERKEAARYDHGYAKDARPMSSQGLHDLAQATLSKEFDGRVYFDDAVKAVAAGRCDPNQLRTVLNELHPELRDRYGLNQPPEWRELPFVRDSAFAAHPTERYWDARYAVDNFVKTLPDGDRYAKDAKNAVESGANRLRAETELYLRTRDPQAPEAIKHVRIHRLASALNAPKHQYDRREPPTIPTLRQLPPELRELYRSARMADPSSRIFRLYR